ncbi:MAG: hypothetical protein Q9212_005635 [Teloschistes hypoglaucus]
MPRHHTPAATPLVGRVDAGPRTLRGGAGFLDAALDVVCVVRAVGGEVEARGHAVRGRLAGMRRWVTGVVQDEPTERSKRGWGTSAVEDAASDKRARILKECMLEEAEKDV